MNRIFIPALAGAVLMSVASLPAFAADIADAQFDPIEYYDPPVALGGWYLRGYIGMTNQRFSGLSYQGFDNPAITHEWLDRGGFGSSPLFGVGVGYQVNQWLRGDVTVEHRGKASFTALDRYTVIADPTDWGTNRYTANKSEWLVLANAYADLGNFFGVRPYVGAGIGTSRNTITHFNDANVITGGGGYADSRSQWQLAWALHAGMGYDITDRATIDLGYSFVNLGNARTGEFRNYDPAQIPNNDGVTFRNLHSHDFKIGLRYKLN